MLEELSAVHILLGEVDDDDNYKRKSTHKEKIIIRRFQERDENKGRDHA